MDFSVILIGVATLSLYIIPFLIAGYSNKNRKNILSNNFLSISKSLGLDITHHDVLYDAVIGIDQTKKVLLYFTTKDDHQEIVDLNNVLSSSVKQHRHTVSNKNDSYTVIDKIELELLLNNRDNTVVALKFYDNEVTYQLYGELQIAEKWQKITQPVYNTVIGHLNISGSHSGRMVG